MIKYLARILFAQKINHAKWVIWIFAEIVLVQILCTINWTDWSINLCGFILCIGSSGTFLIWPKLR